MVLPFFCWLAIDPVTDAVIPALNLCCNLPAALRPAFSRFFSIYIYLLRRRQNKLVKMHSANHLNKWFFKPVLATCLHSMMVAAAQIISTVTAVTPPVTL